MSWPHNIWAVTGFFALFLLLSGLVCVLISGRTGVQGFQVKSINNSAEYRFVPLVKAIRISKLCSDPNPHLPILERSYPFGSHNQFIKGYMQVIFLSGLKHLLISCYPTQEPTVVNLFFGTPISGIRMCLHMESRRLSNIFYFHTKFKRLSFCDVGLHLGRANPSSLIQTHTLLRYRDASIGSPRYSSGIVSTDFGSLSSGFRGSGLIPGCNSKLVCISGLLPGLFDELFYLLVGLRSACPHFIKLSFRDDDIRNGSYSDYESKKKVQFVVSRKKPAIELCCGVAGIAGTLLWMFLMFLFRSGSRGQFIVAVVIFAGSCWLLHGAL